MLFVSESVVSKSDDRVEIVVRDYVTVSLFAYDYNKAGLEIQLDPVAVSDLIARLQEAQKVMTKSDPEPKPTTKPAPKKKSKTGK